MRGRLPLASSLAACSLAFATLLAGQRDDKPDETKPSAVRLKDLRKEKTVDASNWGEDITNPFTAITEEGKAKLKRRDVDIDKLQRMEARLITGHCTGAATLYFVNKDPNTILVFGKDFVTHGFVKSAGPILAMDDAHFMGSDHEGSALFWFVEDSRLRIPERARGSPLIQSEKDGDYGWRRPANFLKPPDRAKDAATCFIADREKKKAKIIDRIKSAEAVSIRDKAKSVANPFTDLTPEGKTSLKRRGIDVDRLAKMSSRLLSGSYFGADRKDFVNADADMILVIGKQFGTHGNVYSVGPIFAYGDSHFSGKVIGADLVWFVESTFPRDEVVGLPVVFATGADWSQMRPGSEDIWHGDYGWRSPRGLR
jgi:hypothetical protein